MKNRNHIIRLVILSIIGSILILLTYQTKYSDGIVESIFLLGIGFIGMIFWVWQIRKDDEKFGKESILKARFALLVGFLLILDIVFIRLRIVLLRNEPSLMEVNGYDEEFVIEIDFQKNGKYVFREYGFLGSDYEYGTYELKDDTIIFDRKHKLLGTERMLIQPMGLDSNEIGNSKIQYKMVEINHSGNRLYEVIEDNR